MIQRAYVVLETSVAPRRLAGVRARIPVGRASEYFRAALDQVYAAARTGAIALDGQNVFVYRPHPDGDLTVEFCVGSLHAFDAIGAVEPIEMPTGSAATTIHWGDYGALNAAHRAVLAWCRENGRRLTGLSWEVYGHWNDDPARVRTDVYHAIE